MKTRFLPILAAVAIAVGSIAATAAISLNTAAAAAPTAIAADTAEAGSKNVGFMRRFRFYRFYKCNDAYPHCRHGYGSYRHCKFLLHKWKYEGRFWAKKRFHRLNCYRFFY